MQEVGCWCVTFFSLLGLLVAEAVKSTPCMRKVGRNRHFGACWESFIPGGPPSRGVLGEFYTGWAAEPGLLGEFYTGWAAEPGVLGESYTGWAAEPGVLGEFYTGCGPARSCRVDSGSSRTWRKFVDGRRV